MTTCTFDRRDLFGEIVNGIMNENAFGAIVRNCWNDLLRHYQHVLLDAFVVMPNHVHGVLALADDSDFATISSQILSAGITKNTTTVPGLTILGESTRSERSYDNRDTAKEFYPKTRSRTTSGFWSNPHSFPDSCRLDAPPIREFQHEDVIGSG